MWQLWKKPLKTTVLSSVLLFYFVLCFTIFKKRKIIDEEYLERQTNLTEVKTLIGYSLRYKVADELQASYHCDNLSSQKLFSIEEEHEKKSILKYDVISDIFVLSVYYDYRLHPYTYIRGVALVPRHSTLYCQLWSDQGPDQPKAVVRSTISPIWANNWESENEKDGAVIPVLISCALPPNQTYDSPNRISFVREPCDIHVSAYIIHNKLPITSENLILNTLPITSENLILPIKTEYHHQDSARFVVCVKPLYYKEDISKDLTEWINFVSNFGAGKIVLYYDTLHENTLNVVKTKSSVHAIKFEKSSELRYGESYKDQVWLKRKLEVLVYNDCFYRNLNNADFIIPLDIDELIVPKNGQNWVDLFKLHFNTTDNAKWKANANKYSSFSVKNAYFFNNYPKKALQRLRNSLKDTSLPMYYHSLVSNRSSSIFRRRIRSLKYSPNGESTKSFINVNNTLSVFNHFGFQLLRPAIRRIIFPVDLAQLNHYRDECDPKLIDNCYEFLNYVTLDSSLFRFKFLQGEYPT